MSNGKEYKIFNKKYFNNSSEGSWYDRKDSNEVYRYYGDSIACESMEYKYFDFNILDSTVWVICADLFFPQSARGIAYTFYDNTYYSYLQKPNEAKQFEDVAIDSADTLWTPNDGSTPIVINKGLGMVWQFIFTDGSYYLQGAIIDGVRFGTIASMTEINSTVPDKFILHQNYPNPFNPTTTINFQIPQAISPLSGGERGGLVTLKIYDVLGNEVATLVNESKSPGNYSVNFNAADLPSGIYIYSLRVNGQIQNCKMILLK
jgi:hypothetical protein